MWQLFDGINSLVLFIELLVIASLVGIVYGFAAGFGTFIVAVFLCIRLPRASAVLMGILVSFLWNGAFFKPPAYSSELDILARYAAAFLVAYFLQNALNQSARDFGES